MKKLLLAALALLAISTVAKAQTCSSYPFTLTNGTTADANQVMSNFNAIRSCANTNLQPLLTLPLSVANGGTGSATASGAATNLGALQISNNLSDVASVSSSRASLGLGTAALQNIGTSGANVPLLNAANTFGAEQFFQASGASAASLNIAQGSAPTTPSNGDIWLTSANLFARVNGATQQLVFNSALGTAAFQNTGTSGANVPLLNGANTHSALNTFSAGVTVSSASTLDMDGAAGTSRPVFWTTSGVNRWAGFADSTAEGGSNTGSNFEIGRYADNGAFIDSPISITRSSGLTSIVDGLFVNGTTTLPSGTTAGGQAVVVTNDQRFIGPTENHQAGNYTLALGDAGNQVDHFTGDGAATWTIPTNASVAFSITTKIELFNDCSGGAVTLTPAGGVTVEWFPSGSTGSRTFAACGLATLTKVGTNQWILTGVSIS